MKKFKVPQNIWGKPKYQYKITYIKNYNNQKLKLVCMYKVKSTGIETKKKILKEEHTETTSKSLENEEKLANNISRAKSKIFELAYCNNWDYFITMTLNQNKQDRTDLNLWHKQLTQWIRDYNKKYKTNIKFLFIPEKHKDGKSWHIHGFISGVPPSSSSAI